MKPSVPSSLLPTQRVCQDGHGVSQRREPVAFGLGGGAPGTPRWGSGFKDALRENFNCTRSVNFFSTSLPLETNNVTLDPELKDAWDLPFASPTHSRSGRHQSHKPGLGISWATPPSRSRPSPTAQQTTIISLAKNGSLTAASRR